MTAWKAEIQVTYKKSVLDPQGVAVEKALGALGYVNVDKVRIGKYMELVLHAESVETARSQVEEMCQRLLTNPVIEDYEYRLQPVSQERGKGQTGS